MSERFYLQVDRSQSGLPHSTLTMSNKLAEINRKDLPLLRRLYDSNDPDTYIAHTTIDTYIRWFDRYPRDPNNEKIKFYSLNGDFTRGTFIVTDDYTRTAYTNTLSENTDKLLQLLLLIDYSTGYLFYALNKGPESALKQALKRKKVEISPYLPSAFYRLPKEKALQFDVQPPDGIELKPLNDLNLKKAFSVWPPCDYTSFRLFEFNAKSHMNIGAFKSDGTLVAWVLRWQCGLLMALQTDEKYYGRGYGSLVKKALAKKIAETGYDVYTATLETNLSVRRLYEKLGFERLDSMKYWLYTKLN